MLWWFYGFFLQDIADANDQQLREEFPNMPSFGHDTAAYARDLTNPDWSDEELLASFESGLLHPLHLNTLRQAEQELCQADVFTRLLPAQASARCRPLQAFPIRTQELTGSRKRPCC